MVNYELPDEPETYVHRIGRTGRNGASGAAITLCAGDELSKLRAIERLIRKPLMPEGVTAADIRNAKAAPKGKPNRGSHSATPRPQAKGGGSAQGNGSKRRRPRRAGKSKPAHQAA